MPKLNVGCGRNIRDGWINLDSFPLPGVDLVADLETCDRQPLPLADNSIDELLLSHVIEHIHKPLPMMQELWRVARAGAVLTARVPYGSSDDAWEDQTHVRPYFVNSFCYFAQPFYSRADYGYRGDWQPETVVLVVPETRIHSRDTAQLKRQIEGERNVVQEMIVTLRCIKPLREPAASLQAFPRIEIQIFSVTPGGQ